MVKQKPETLKEWSSQPDTLRSRLKIMPSNHPLIREGLRDCQFEAIQNLEQSFAEGRPRALIQMATGSGKTYTAVSFIYRLIKFAGARRVLFLVDRSNLGRQTRKEFAQYVTPDDGRKFTELYNVQHLTSNTIDPVSKVCITTIQRLYSMLSGGADFEPENEEQSLFEISPDECHRSIYGLWRQVLEYFDAFIIGYEVYRIKTNITEKGSRVEAGEYVDKRDKLTRKVRWEQLDEPLEYTPEQLDRSVVAKDQIRTIIKKFIEENKDEITALQIIYSKPYSRRHLTFKEINEVADAIKKPPYQLTPELLWQAYEQLDKSKVKGAVRAYQLFGKGLNNILEELNEVLAA